MALNINDIDTVTTGVTYSLHVTDGSHPDAHDVATYEFRGLNDFNTVTAADVLATIDAAMTSLKDTILASYPSGYTAELKRAYLFTEAFTDYEPI
jgi:hypothetical protein